MTSDPHTFILSWRNITAWTNVTRNEKSQQKRLLNNELDEERNEKFCGMAKSGSLMAVISPSGGGKTTLLAVLGGRYKGNKDGEILMNGQQITSEQISYLSGFVCQKNLLIGELTVEEHLQFMAHLKLGHKMCKETVNKNMTKVVENLVLSHRMHVKIRELSGGQLKRLSLAVQLLTEPKVLFCDEPTTGLDSYNAVMVVKLLRSIANQGKIIICAIHQPASGLFEMFDDVSLLISNGSLAYHGPVAEIQNHFARLGLKCPENYNLCEFIVSQATIRPSMFKEATTDKMRAEKLVVEFYQSGAYKNIETYSLVMMNDSSLHLPPDLIHSELNHRKPPFYTQLRWLFWRASLLLSRSWKTWALRFLIYIFVFSCLSLPFGVIEINQTGIQNVQGLLHVLQLEMLYASMYGVINFIPEQITVFVQESSDHLYSPLPFYLSYAILLSTKAVFEAFILANYTFQLTGLGMQEKLLDYVTSVRPVLALSLTSCAYGFFLSTAFDSITTASLFSVPLELISNVFAGLYLRLRSLPSYIVWMKYLSLSYYTYEALSVNEWVKHDHIYCEREDPSQCYMNGDQVLASYGFNRDDIYIDYLGLIVYAIVLHALGFFFLVRQLKTIAAY